jgi:hypothetical protein
MTAKSYSVEKLPHGYLICGSDGGIPLTALRELESLATPKTVIDLGIVHHYRVSGKPHVVYCLVEPAAQADWRNEIRQAIASLPPEERWWRGLDVGLSSASVFAVFAAEPFKTFAREYGRGAVPRDADDFGRCVRLLEMFPHWKRDLHRVSESYPATAWATVIEEWDRLAAADSTSVNKTLGAVVG